MTNDGAALPAAAARAATGLGKPLKSSIHPLREDIPIYLGAEGPKNIALARRAVRRLAGDAVLARARGALPDALSEGFARDGRAAQRRGLRGRATVPLIVSDDVERRADALRPFYALYFGGMGAKGTNFHANVAIRMGYEREVDEIQDLYLAGKKDEAGGDDPARADRAAVADRAAGEDPPRPRGVARVDRDDAAGRRRRRDAAHRRRARPRLAGAASSGRLEGAWAGSAASSRRPRAERDVPGALHRTNGLFVHWRGGCSCLC